jgi:diguanylate cyclase (GGDEF)-like protein
VNQLIDLKEIFAVNGISLLMMGFLLLCRRKNRGITRNKDRIYDGMILITMVGAVWETVSFLVDGQDIFAGRILNYLSNTINYASTVTIGLLWCLYVELHVYKDREEISKNIKLTIIPWAVEIIALIINLFGTGLMFSVSEDNVYSREDGIIIGYITLVLYIAYSVYLVYSSKTQKLRLYFFPILNFVIPCFIGTVLQLFFYGISTSFVSVSIALIFVQMQLYAENAYMDELSGLLNRRYLNGVLSKKEKTEDSLHGIMMDVNDFKEINDTFGHNAGDRAVRWMGELLIKSVPKSAIVIRYSGDEFVALLPDIEEDGVRSVMDKINSNLDTFNKEGKEPFALTVSMGYAKFELDDNQETFQRKMDDAMYEEKSLYHMKKQERS